MKKSLLLLLAAVLLPLAMGAQLPLIQQAGSPKAFNTRHMAPERADLGENQKLLGHYDSDNLATEGISMRSKTGTLAIGTVLTPEELMLFQGGKIVGFRVGLAESTPVTRVFVAPVNEQGVKNGVGTITSWSCNKSDVGWNVVMLDTPYEINLPDNYSLLIGFDYAQTVSNAPLSAVKEGTIYPTYLYQKLGRKDTWTDVGLQSYGNISVQCIVENDNFPDYLLKFTNLTAERFVTAGQDLNFRFKIKNYGLKTVEAGTLGFDLKIDGTLVGTMTNPMDFLSPFVNIDGIAPTTGFDSGIHTLSVTMSTLNGEPLEEPVTLETDFRIFAKCYDRQKHLLEQLTSTYCTYCPLGNSMLSILKSQRDDVIWVGIHGNLGSGTDPFRSNQGDTIMSYLTGGYISYPSGAFDRSTGWEDDVNIANGIGYYEEYHQQVADELGNFFDYISESMPSFATIEITRPDYYDLADSEVTVTVSGELSPDFESMMGEDAKLTVYLVEDSLVARQLNDGTWEKDYVHNGVFRCALGSVFGSPFNRTDDGGYKNDYTFTLSEDWDINNLRIVAFISRPLRNAVNGFTDLYVNNAEIAPFYCGEVGVEELFIDEDVVPVAYFDVMGRQLDGIHQGVNIVLMSNGTAKKVLVK